MANRDDIPKTDPSEIEALIQRLNQSNLEPRDAQLVEQLLRLALSSAQAIDLQIEFRQAHCHWKFAGRRSRSIGKQPIPDKGHDDGNNEQKH